MICDFDRLRVLLDKELQLDEALELFDHLDNCDVCFEEVYRIYKERDSKFFRFKSFLYDESRLFYS